MRTFLSKSLLLILVCGPWKGLSITWQQGRRVPWQVSGGRAGIVGPEQPAWHAEGSAAGLRRKGAHSRANDAAQAAAAVAALLPACCCTHPEVEVVQLGEEGADGFVALAVVQQQQLGAAGRDVGAHKQVVESVNRLWGAGHETRRAGRQVRKRCVPLPG